MGMSNFVWVTPNPEKVKKMIAICSEGRAIECYLGEKWLINKSFLGELKMYGFVECDGNVTCFKTPEEAEQADLRYRIITK